MSDTEILEKFEKWLSDETDSMGDWLVFREAFKEASYILRTFRKIKNEGRKKRHEESVESDN